ncbi:hypothetical protein [Albibacterium profundi]|uniref:Right handed beta helix domain-containing protein n=1 Tax=Albibacterium profundi TaxID=3134906 RepID=A0ABV5CAY0_9SPHI
MKVKSVKMGLLGCAFLFFLYSCEVEQIEPAKPVENENVIDSAETEKETIDSSRVEKKDENIEVIGTGSGKLVIKDVENKNFSIKPGVYGDILIENTKNTSIKGDKNVKIVGSTINISNVDNIEIAGITIENGTKGIYISKSANDLTLKDINLKNISTYGIRFDVNKKFDNSPQSYSKNIQLINIKAENVRVLFESTGGIETDGFYGLIKGFKLTGSTIVNSPNLESAVYLNLGEDFEVSNNVVNNVNTNNNNHNGIFHVKGNGKIFNNKITNHQGNAVRSWLFSITKPNSLVEIYNNIVYNSRRYSAFEVQVTPDIKGKVGFKPANAKIYNNTVGKMNTGQPKYYEGRIIDIYQTFGSVEVYNNLYFDMRDNIVSLNQSNPNDTKVKETNNRYFKNANEAVTDLTAFISKIPGIGAKL